MKTIKLAAVAVLGLMIAGCGHKYEQPELGARKVQIITEGNYQFKDLNTPHYLQLCFITSCQASLLY